MFFNAASILTSIRKVPETNRMLARNRVKPLLNFGNADCSKPKATPAAPIKTSVEGSPMRKFPKKYKPVPKSTKLAPTSSPEHVAQKFLLPMLKMCVE